MPPRLVVHNMLEGQSPRQQPLIYHLRGSATHTDGCCCLLYRALQRRLGTTLSAAYGDDAWQLVPQSYSLPGELQQWSQWLQQQEAQGTDPGPWMLKTAQHLGKGLVLLPGQQAYQAAMKPR